MKPDAPPYRGSHGADLQPLLEADSDGWVGIMSQWLAWHVIDLRTFLTPEGVPGWLWQRRRTTPPKGLKAIAGIGYKQSSVAARALCDRWGLPYLALEDGFLRSSSLGVEGDTPLSMVVDPIGIHYLADRPSLLETILLQVQTFTEEELATADALITLMRTSGIGKYNNTPDLPASDDLGKHRPLVIVVDQTYGDFAISGGGLTESDFPKMLQAALEENPDADVRVRIHPDCLAGYKRSCLLDAAKAKGVALESRQVSWASLARRATRVYVGTSQAGLEALIQGVPVTCFGAPFYAGWGLTEDRLPTPRRHHGLSLQELVAAAYIRYCRYVDPRTGERCDVMTVARHLANQKRQDMDFSGQVTVVGVPPHQQKTLRPLLVSRWGTLAFADWRPALLDRLKAQNGRLVMPETAPAWWQAEARARGVDARRFRIARQGGEGGLLVASLIDSSELETATADVSPTLTGASHGRRINRLTKLRNYVRNVLPR